MSNKRAPEEDLEPEADNLRRVEGLDSAQPMMETTGGATKSGIMHVNPTTCLDVSTEMTGIATATSQPPPQLQQQLTLSPPIGTVPAAATSDAMKTTGTRDTCK